MEARNESPMSVSNDNFRQIDARLKNKNIIIISKKNYSKIKFVKSINLISQILFLFWITYRKRKSGSRNYLIQLISFGALKDTKAVRQNLLE